MALALGCDGGGSEIPFVTLEEYQERKPVALCEMLARCGDYDEEQCLTTERSHLASMTCFSGTTAYECLVYLETLSEEQTCPMSDVRACANYSWGLPCDINNNINP